MEEGTQYYSTNLKAPHVPFRKALLKGLAPDAGLYMPLRLPRIPSDDLEALTELTYPELATEIIGRIIGNEISSVDLLNICKEIYSFGIPLELVYDRNYLMRLDQGPTASFKDFAALLMGRLMQHFLSQEEKHITILTATSGDTGSAVANAFYGLKNIRVIILFPSGEVTDMQRRQMTTFHDNIQVVEINGKFDDCQRLVKAAFMDPLLSPVNLSSANSINIGRLLPQSVYYFWAWAQLSGKTTDDFIFSVPCGNFGNLAGGLIARDMGLPVKHFIISTNDNDEVPLFLKTGIYKPVRPSRNSISSAMNVGHPSNLARIISMYGGNMDENGIINKSPDLARMRQDFYASVISDRKTRETIYSIYKEHGKILEPHGGVAWAGMQKYCREHPSDENNNVFCVSLETAHPAKFLDEIISILNIEPELPESLRKIAGRTEEYIYLENNYDALKKFIIQNY
ncbi:MAG TPA: threonine synthase [Bacteroidales bacterium]|nr:threonine synthase [Bacteroidales bacterium]HBZ20524.1 threonine synthase [Bacteroidales bacterium]